MLISDNHSMQDIYTNLIRIAKSDRSKRLSVITDILDEKVIPYRLQHFETGTNVIMSTAGHCDLDLIFMAHHDIAAGTIQGANDNTASVAVLIKLAAHLQNVMPHYNVHIALTDNEEHLGAVLSKNVSNHDKFRIVTEIGSYRLLKTFSQTRTKAVINMEMSGIGDSIYIADSSGNVPCSQSLNGLLDETAHSMNISTCRTAVSNSDMLAVHIRRLNGTVIGAMPNGSKVTFGEFEIPHQWATMHSPQDTIDKIEPHALSMMFEFVKAVCIKN